MLRNTVLLFLSFVPAFGHAGLALSIGVGALINATWLFVGLRSAGAYEPRPGWGPFALRVLFATALLGGLLFASARYVDWLGLGAHPWQRGAWLAASLLGAALVYFGALLATGLRPGEFARRSV